MSNKNTELEKRINYVFKDKGLLTKALTHSSVDAKFNNERMEFLGDRVLGLVISNMLFNSHKNEREGNLTVRFSKLVQKNTLARVAEEINLPLNMLGADPKHKSQKAVRADACEALIAAVFIDGGFEQATELIKRLWREEIKAISTIEKDPRNILQEWAQDHQLPLPEYQEIKRTGEDHNLEFTMQVTLKPLGTASSSASSKREAAKDAAKILLQKIAKYEPK